MTKLLKLTSIYTPAELLEYLESIENELSKIGIGLKELDYSMVGDVIVDASQKVQEAQDIIKEWG